MSVHTASLRGERAQNEDKHNVILNLNNKNKNMKNIDFLGIYDGHGGKFVSKFLSNELPQIFTDKRVEYPLHKGYINKMYTFLQDVLYKKYSIYSTNTGSAALVVSISNENNNNYINVINLGDSRCVLCRNNLAIPLTKDHKPNWPEEHNRIKKLGGNITFDNFDWRIKDLSVSRAFGDLDASPYISCLPDIFKYKVSNDDKFIILGCDGLWDVISSQDAVNFILDQSYNMENGSRINIDTNSAKLLAQYAIKKGSHDNVTIIIKYF
jgi:serine/threonine protein phosphatase PrpC